MNENVAPNVVPKDLMLEVVCNKRKMDPLGIDLNASGPSLWTLDQLTAILAVRILALSNRVDGLMRQNLMNESRVINTDMSSLAIVIRDLQIWPLINGQELNFKYGGAIYKVNAQNPRKFEEIERAKNFVPKSLKKDS